MLTPDKDYAQLVRNNVFMFRPRHGGGYEKLGVQEIEEKYSITSPLQVIDLLALMGDSADNFLAVRAWRKDSHQTYQRVR